MADTGDGFDVPVDSPTFRIDAPTDLRVAPAHLAFGSDVVLFKSGPTLLLRNYSLDGKPIQVALYAGGRIEQRDTASQIAMITNLTIEITVNGMQFEIDQHAVLSTPSDLMYALDGSANQVQVLQALGQKLQGVDTIAMVHFKYFLNSGTVDTSKGPSVLHMGPSKDGYKLSIQIACLRLAVALKAIRFLAHLIKETEYVWITYDLDMSQIVALVQAAPYLDKILVTWTFVVIGQNLVEKDCLINSALVRLPHYRHVLSQHAARYAGGPLMPSVYNFLVATGQIPSTTSLMLEPSEPDTNPKSTPFGLATPPTKNDNIKEETNGEDGQVIVGKQP